jgi:hypothetical protein
MTGTKRTGLPGLIIAQTRSAQGETTWLGCSAEDAPASYPLRPFYLELPSGMRHWFTSEERARASQYWPGRDGAALAEAENAQAQGTLSKDAERSFWD